MRLLSALALTVAAVLATVFWSCDHTASDPPLPLDATLPGHNANDAPQPPGDVFQPVDATFFPDASFPDAQQTGFPDASF